MPQTRQRSLSSHASSGGSGRGSSTTDAFGAEFASCLIQLRKTHPKILIRPSTHGFQYSCVRFSRLTPDHPKQAITVISRAFEVFNSISIAVPASPFVKVRVIPHIIDQLGAVADNLVHPPSKNNGFEIWATSRPTPLYVSGNGPEICECGCLSPIFQHRSVPYFPLSI